MSAVEDAAQAELDDLRDDLNVLRDAHATRTQVVRYATQARDEAAAALRQAEARYELLQDILARSRQTPRPNVVVTTPIARSPLDTDTEPEPDDHPPLGEV